MQDIQEHAGIQKEPHVEHTKCPQLYITYVTYCTLDLSCVCLEDTLHYMAPARHEEKRVKLLQSIQKA